MAVGRYDETSELGLYLAGAGVGTGRHYDPETGQFVSADSVEDDVNAYRYVRNNPVNRVDPSGAAAPPIVVAIVVGALIGAIEGAIIGAIVAWCQGTSILAGALGFPIAVTT